MQVIQDLKESGMYKNSLVLVTTDNGGEPWYSNLPLRGKVDLFLFSFFEFIFVTQVYNEKRFYIITQSFSESKSSLFERGLKLFLGLYC